MEEKGHRVSSAALCRKDIPNLATTKKCLLPLRVDKRLWVSFGGKEGYVGLRENHQRHFSL